MTEIVCTVKEAPLVVIVSAMGKSTNKLEDLLQLHYAGKNWTTALQKLEKYHFEICQELFPIPDHKVFQTVTILFQSLTKRLELIGRKPLSSDYDSVISYGELVSSTIVFHLLNDRKPGAVQLIDARRVIKTDDNHQEANVITSETNSSIVTSMENKDVSVFVSQGFLGASPSGETTTLGREGSDYTAAIFGQALRATSVTFWKDVPGIMNADPKRMPEARLINELPYQEVAEMTYYGAKVIHPKTIRPLANCNIPMYVRSFENTDVPGTWIHDCKSWKREPIFVYKEKQCLVSFKFSDFAFVDERHLIEIYNCLASQGMKISMMQNSAVSVSVCIDYLEEKIGKLLNQLESRYEVYYNSGLTLVTIKNYDSKSLAKYRPTKNVLLEQQSRLNYQAVYYSPG